MHTETVTENSHKKWKCQISQSTISELLSFGEIDEDKPWDSYLNFNLTDEKTKELEKILEFKSSGDFDIDEDNEAEDELHANLPIHSWRILSAKNSIASLPAIINLFRNEHEDDWVWFEIRTVLDNFGKSVVDPIIESISERPVVGNESFCAAALVEVLTEVAKKYSEEKNKISNFLYELIRSFEVLPPSFISHLIIALVELKNLDALPTIQKIFEKKFNDEQIIDWQWVKDELISDIELPEKIITEKMATNNFKYSGDENFQKLLKTIESKFTVESLKLQIVGALLAVDMVQPSILIDNILNPNGDDEIEGFQSEGQARYFYQEFLGLWNQLTDYQDKLYPLPQLRSFDNDVNNESVANLAKMLHLYSSILSFLYGLKEGNTDTERASSFDSSGFISFLLHQANQVDSLVESNAITPETTEKFLNETRTFWDNKYLTFAFDCREKRKSILERSQFIEANKNVGRNDPCPCRSGKKFKKCCLMEH